MATGDSSLFDLGPAVIGPGDAMIDTIGYPKASPALVVRPDRKKPVVHFHRFQETNLFFALTFVLSMRSEKEIHYVSAWGEGETLSIALKTSTPSFKLAADPAWGAVPTA